jgi:hypothetical protein
LMWRWRLKGNLRNNLANWHSLFLVAQRSDTGQFLALQ